MSTPYVGEIRLVGFTFAPPGWLACDGSLQSIANYDVLYALIGTTYGGDGSQTFALPDLRGKVPVHQGQGLGLSNYILGQVGGLATVTLTAQQMGNHNHQVACQNSPGGSVTPANAFFSLQPTAANKAFLPAPPAATYAAMASVVGPAGNSQPHDNMQPYLAVPYIIATQGIYPSQG